MYKIKAGDNVISGNEFSKVKEELEAVGKDMMNPCGEVWYVVDTTMDETGRFPVPIGYWEEASKGS